jgi:hypothetical protein
MPMIRGSLIIAPGPVTPSALNAGSVSADEIAMPKHGPEPEEPRTSFRFPSNHPRAGTHGLEVLGHNGTPLSSTSHLTPRLGGVA